MEAITPKSRIVAGLRKMWLWSRERNEAMRYYDRTCQKCGVRESKAKGREQKIQVHHKDGILNWDEIVFEIRKNLLVSPDKLECLCPECHKKETYGEH